LNQLLFSRQGTEVELNWLVENYLTETERAQLRQIQNSTQGNLFFNNESQASLNSQSHEVRADEDPDSSANVVVYEYEEIIAEIDAEMKRLGWSVSDGQNFLSDRYGKKSRINLSDEQLIEFWHYLRGKETNER
jgi:hypothetical protein